MVKNTQYLIDDLDHVRIFNAESSISFYRNGEFQGVAFRNLPVEFWYPAVSLYMDAAVEVNFGPNFDHVRIAHTRDGHPGRAHGHATPCSPRRPFRKALQVSSR